MAKDTTLPHETLSVGQHSAFYNVPLFPPEAPSLASARCPRCSLPLLVLPVGTDPAAMSLALGEVIELLQAAQDAIAAAQGTIEEQVTHHE
jgi:hypothetical protein